MEVAVHTDALTLRESIEKLGAKVWGEDETAHTLYLCFPGTVRVDLISTHRREFPKPGRPVFHAASIQDDLRRRDFTVNAMAISLNEGSYGLLMDPLNGAADIEARTLRLISNYGFLDQPSLLVRATRYRARLGWEMDPRTQMRYENARAEGIIEHIAPMARSYELEQIGHEADGLRVLHALDAEGWMQHLFPAWTASRADEEKLNALHDLAVQLMIQGVHPDMSAAQMQLLTAKMPPKDLSALKKLMLRPGFVEEWSSLDLMASAFAKVLLAKDNQTPSVSYKLFTSYDPEAVLWLGFTAKDAAVKERYRLFLTVWPEARQRIPYALMQEMRITPELATYAEIVQQLFLQLIDGNLGTPEEQRAFLEPFSPPAPPPQVTIKRSRAKRAEAKLKERSFDEEEEEEEELGEEDLDDIGGEEEDLDLGIPKEDLEPEAAEEVEEEAGYEEEEEAAPRKRGRKEAPAPKQPKPAPPAKVAAPSKPAPAAKPAAKAHAAPKAAAHPPKAVPAPAAKKPAAPPAKAPAKAAFKPAAKPAAKKAAAKPAPKTPAKAAPKAPAKPPVKPAAKPAAKHAPAKKKPAPPAKAHKPAKPAARKPAHKPGKKR